MIEIEYDGKTARFDDSEVNPDRPGNIYAPLLAGRFYEHKFLHYIRTLERTGNYVDVGANIGTHTVFFAVMCPSDHVFSFEPRPRICATLDRNVALNDQQDRVTTSTFAVSDSEGEITVELDGRDHVLVTRLLDDLVTVPVSVLKIDVEGMEPHVLAGASRILAQDAPVVFAEAFTLDDASTEALHSTMLAHGYEKTGRVFNYSPTFEYIPNAERRAAMGWTGPLPVEPAASPKPRVAPAPATPRSTSDRFLRWLRRQPPVRALARWRNGLRHR